MKHWTRVMTTRGVLAGLLLAGSAGPMVGMAAAQRDRHHNFDDGYRRGHGYNDRDDRNYEREHQGGIGPGKGALIGGAGGAALGALFGGGVKGALIGGGIGAGGGAILGKVHQNNQRKDDYRDYRDDNGHYHHR